MTCTESIIAPTPAISDLGGYRGTAGVVSRGRLFLAEDLNREPDAARAAAPVRLTSIVDLRPATEVARAPLFVPGVSYYHLPAVGSLDRDARTIAETLAFLTDPWAYPALLHCSAGRHHAALVIAVVLGILGLADCDLAGDDDASTIVRRYGSFDAYAAAIGVGSAAGYLRAALLT